MCLLALSVACLLAPQLARADIYTWTDEHGSTVISNLRPANTDKLRNFELAIKETERDAQRPRGAGRQEPTRVEQILLDRIDSLEREIRAQQYSQGPPAVYYRNPPPPPPPLYDETFYPGYYPGYIYPSYSYVLPGHAFLGRGRAHFGVGHRGFNRSGFGRAGVGHAGFVRGGRMGR